LSIVVYRVNGCFSWISPRCRLCQPFPAPAEPAWRSFAQSVLPEARRRGLGVIGMKVLCRGFGLQVPGCNEASDWIRYALAHEVSTVVIGCDDPTQVAENAAAARQTPLMAEECRALEHRVAPYARRLMYYKPG